jgi:integrase
MSKKNYLFLNAPTNAPTIHIIDTIVSQYSKVKLFIPKTVKGNKKVPCVATGCSWYVYYYFRNPETGKFDSRSKFDYKHGINRYKTIAQRKAFGEKLVIAYTTMLDNGYNPWNNTILKKDLNTFSIMTLSEAMNYAMEMKKKELATNTNTDWKHRLLNFQNFIKKMKFDVLPVTEINTKHIILFLNSLDLSGKSINNYRAFLSTIFSFLLNEMIVETNPVTAISKRKENPTKNKPFTPEEIDKIKKYLQDNDPGLLFYIRFVALAFLRPVEVCRLTVQDIDLSGNKLRVKTKTESTANVRIIPQLKEQLQLLNLQKYNPNDFIITRTGIPGPWIYKRTGTVATETTRTSVMSKRFKKVKEHLKFSDEYGIYSIRHTFALDLYGSFINEGCTSIEAELKMLPITRHKSISGLRNYLRGIGALIPKDYSNNITIKL